MTTPEVEAFLENFQTLMMASLTPQGLPYASTAPYVRMGRNFYLLISTVAQHGRNLLANPAVSLLFAEDEARCPQPFARKRITIEAEAAEVLRDESDFSVAVEVFKGRFDTELVSALSSMGDFRLFRLIPLGGSAVMGFGKAFGLNGQLEVMEQITGHHRKKGDNG